MTGLDRSALDAMQERADAATPGPWTRNGRNLVSITAPLTAAEEPRHWRDGIDLDGKRERVEVARVPTWSDWTPVRDGWFDADAEFIAHSREDIPALLAENARLVDERDKAQTLLAETEHDWAVDRQIARDWQAAAERAEATLAEVRALADPADACRGCPPEGWTHDGWSIRLDVLAEFRAILDRRQGGEA